MLNMKLLSHHTLNGHGGMWEGMGLQLAKDGRRVLWLAHESAPKNFTAVDVSDPRQPRVIVQTDLPHAKMRSNSLEVSGNLMAVAYQTSEYGLKPAGFELFDISVPEKPRSISTFDASGPFSRGCHQLWFVDGETVHMSCADPDLKPRNPKDDQIYRIVDVSNPSRPVPVGRWHLPALILVGLYLVPTAILPAIALGWASVTPYLVPLTLENLQTLVSLDAYGTVLVDRVFWESLGRTVIIAGLSATIAVTVATITAWTVARRRSTWSTRLLDIFASSSVAIPATIAGFASFLFYLVINRSVPLLGTIWVLVLAYSYRIAVSYRVSYSATLQISPELEESAAASGSSSGRVRRSRSMAGCWAARAA